MSDISTGALSTNINTSIYSMCRQTFSAPTVLSTSQTAVPIGYAATYLMNPYVNSGNYC